MSNDKSSCNWDPNSCQSLLGYAAPVHERSGGICAYCDYGKGGKVQFDMWRQLSVEHVIPSPVIWRDAVKDKLARVFGWSKDDWPKKHQPQKGHRGYDFQKAIEEACCVTACHFCNSMTNRFLKKELEEEFHRILDASDIRAECGEQSKKEYFLKRIRRLANEPMGKKRECVAERIDKLREAFGAPGGICDTLNAKRSQT